MNLYRIFEEKSNSDVLGTYISYGIYAQNECGETVIKISDISIDKAFTDNLCRECNKNKLSPIHLRDVLEDIL